MRGATVQSRRIWELVRRQHGVVARRQLLQLGLSPKAIEHRPEISQLGEWTAAVLACGDSAVLSHGSAAALWRLLPPCEPHHVSVVAGRPRRPRILVHRRMTLTDVTTHRGVPVTSLLATLVDLAATGSRRQVVAAVNEADRLDLVNPERLRSDLATFPARAGVAVLRAVLDAPTLTFTRSELERRLLPIADAAGLPRPQTNVRVNGFEVDFYWHELGLVVETDGLRYHRTPAQQTRDRLRDQTHTAAGLTQLRFTHEQVRGDPEYVRRTLAATARRIG
jgi:very-short-patch-repair endonuclease